MLTDKDGGYAVIPRDKYDNILHEILDGDNYAEINPNDAMWEQIEAPWRGVVRSITDADNRVHMRDLNAMLKGPNG